MIKYCKTQIKILGLVLSLILLSGLTAAFIFNTNSKNSKVSKYINKIKHNKKKRIIPAESITPGKVAPWDIKRSDGKKIAYLTFDDGPSVNTTSILQILDQNKIKANFFIIGSNAEKYPNLVKKESDDGQVVGNHTYSHQLNYREGPNGFVQDVNRCDKILKSILGQKYTSELVRFPGGSFDDKRHPGRLAPFRDSITKAGYRYIDWNDETNDSQSFDPTVPYLLNQLKRNTQGKNVVVVLMHDAGAKKNTVKALQQVIDYLRSQGFIFDTVK